MIAPLKQVGRQTGETRRHMKLARWLVASSLLRRRAHSPDHAPPVPAWLAWAFALWALSITAIYSLILFNLLP